jgi:hypothetical protein
MKNPVFRFFTLDWSFSPFVRQLKQEDDYATTAAADAWPVDVAGVQLILDCARHTHARSVAAHD